MKAIHYKGQNKFYLFDKPERAKNSPRYYGEIINPEVLQAKLPIIKGRSDGKWRYVDRRTQELKPGDIFDLPDNIGFEDKRNQRECKACKIDCLKNLHGIPCKAPIGVRLFLKEEVSPVESQDELWREAIFENFANGPESLKSKFTITRNT